VNKVCSVVVALALCTFVAFSAPATSTAGALDKVIKKGGGKIIEKVLTHAVPVICVIGYAKDAYDVLRWLGDSGTEKSRSQ